jgi:hypothetical protein
MDDSHAANNLNEIFFSPHVYSPQFHWLDIVFRNGSVFARVERGAIKKSRPSEGKPPAFFREISQFTR